LVRASRLVLLVACLTLISVGVWLSLAYWRWGLIPLAAIVYLACVVVMAGMIAGTFREIFGGMDFDKQ
jgi:hypothetical protein